MRNYYWHSFPLWPGPGPRQGKNSFRIGQTTNCRALGDRHHVSAARILQTSLISCQWSGTDTDSAFRSDRRAGNLSVIPWELQRRKPAGTEKGHCNACMWQRQWSPGTAWFVTQLWKWDAPQSPNQPLFPSPFYRIKDKWGIFILRHISFLRVKSLRRPKQKIKDEGHENKAS